MTLYDPEDATRPARSEALALSRAASSIDLGHEPPLSSSGRDAPDIDKREVNLRWLGASVLTGITGSALIGASIYIALEGATVIARAPERAIPIVRSSSSDDHEPGLRKGDRLNRAHSVASAKQGFRAPITLRTGDRETIKVRQFVRLATSLSLTVGASTANIPKFNPLQLFAQGNGERPVDPAPVIDDGDADVSVVKHDLARQAVDGQALTLSDEDVLAILEEERRMGTSQSAVPAIPPQQMLSRSLRQPGGLGEALSYAGITQAPFGSIEVRVVPENVTNLPREEPKESESSLDDREFVLRKGETIESILRALGASVEQIRMINVALGTKVKVSALTEGQRMRVLIASGPRPGDGRQVTRVVLFGEHGIEAIAAANDEGQFVSVTPPPDEAEDVIVADDEGGNEEEDNEAQGGVRLYESLYETALKNDLPRQTVDDLVQIFGFDVDFQRRVSPGDKFELFYATDEGDTTPEVLYASLTVAGETRQVYRYQGEGGGVDFFDELGRSLKKFLLRKPISEGILRSGFGFRRHPVLGYSKMHTGIDWANKIGTPILAAGNGTVIKAEWDSGYGRRIEIQHPNGYVSAYSHQSRFANGIGPGIKVRQGQVIGYLGSTGLSTGPHLHYEVLVNGHFVDPLKIRIPRGQELDGRALAEFKRQREQVDGLMEKAGATARLAQRADLR